MKTNDWQELTKLTRSSPFVVERIRLTDSNIAVEGNFELPALARLTAEDQIFVMAFVRAEGSIKEMERMFGVSYPTIKNRLGRIGEQLQFIESMPSSGNTEVIAALERGEISAVQAIERLSK
jgi:hypothetical protein